MNREWIVSAYSQALGHNPSVVAFAPGRVNIIGEHTDYNDGFVFPAAIDRGVAVAGRMVAGTTITLRSLDFADTCVFQATELTKDPEHAWANYFKGVIWALGQRGIAVPACEAVVTGDLPTGAGLSSSAAYEVATVLFFQALAGFSVSPEDVATIARAAENGFVGVNCGIMDQMASTFGQQGRALRIDCRSLERELVSLPAGLKIVVVDTGVKHSLGSSAYNQRRSECEKGVRILAASLPDVRALAASLPDVRALRDVTFAQLKDYLIDMPPVVAKRCRHVVTENERVEKAMAAMQAGDRAQLKKLLAASHTSLRDDYEVSCYELDVLVDLALPQACCHGSRLTGAGFGGCTVNLVDTDAVDAFGAAVTAGYKHRTGKTATVHVFEPSAGARLL